VTVLQDIEDAWDAGEGEMEKVRALADAYVSDHPDEFKELSAMSVEQLVQAVDVFRQAGLKESLLRVEAWLWHHFEPQNIGGPATVTVRQVG
jgi:hypothetical protein